MEDTGCYTCVIEEFVKPGEDNESSALLQVEEYPHKFTSQLKGQNVIEKDECTFEIDCEAEDAEVTWYQNGKAISIDDPRVIIVKKGKKRKITIKSCKMSDAGEITVKTNVDSSSADLCVTCEYSYCILSLVNYTLNRLTCLAYSKDL